MLGRAKFIGRTLQNILQGTVKQNSLVIANNESSFMRRDTVLNLRPFPFRSFSTSDDSGGSTEISNIFKKVAETSYKLLYLKLDEQDKRDLSALFMQITEGKCPDQPENSKPSEVAYWKEWKELGEMSVEEAAQKYLKIAKKYLTK